MASRPAYDVEQEQKLADELAVAAELDEGPAKTKDEAEEPLGAKGLPGAVLAAPEAYAAETTEEVSARRLTELQQGRGYATPAEEAALIALWASRAGPQLVAAEEEALAILRECDDDWDSKEEEASDEEQLGTFVGAGRRVSAHPRVVRPGPRGAQSALAAARRAAGHGPTSG